jgi:hypothetical protein
MVKPNIEGYGNGAPFDLSWLAIAHGDGQGRFLGGFSFVLWGDTNSDGTVRENMFQPRLLIQALDSKRAFIEFARPIKVDWLERIPDDSTSHQPEPGFSFRGAFLDARTLVYALTAESHSLDSACELFGIENPKFEIAGHGQITVGYRLQPQRCPLDRGPDRAAARRVREAPDRTLTDAGFLACLDRQGVPGRPRPPGVARAGASAHMRSTGSR